MLFNLDRLAGSILRCSHAFHSSMAILFVVQIAAVSEKNGTTVISISHLEVDMEVNPLSSYRTVSEMFKKQKRSDGLTCQYCKPVLWTGIRDPVPFCPLDPGWVKKSPDLDP
jgi:hypothetical protein